MEGGRDGRRKVKETHTKEVQPMFLFVLYFASLNVESQLPHLRIFIPLYKSIFYWIFSQSKNTFSYHRMYLFTEMLTHHYANIKGHYLYKTSLSSSIPTAPTLTRQVKLSSFVFPQQLIFIFVLMFTKVYCSSLFCSLSDLEGRN